MSQYKQFIFLLALFIGVSAQAASPLDAILINTRDLKKTGKLESYLQQQIDPSVAKRLRENNDLCKKFDHGCLVIGFRDDMKTLTRGGQKTIAQIPGVALEFFGLEKQSVRQLRIRDESAINSLFSAFWSGRISESILRKQVMHYPMGFEALAKIHRHSFFNKRKIAVLEDITIEALLLTLNAVAPAADASSVSYFYDDTAVQIENMVDVSWIYTKLTEVNRWPTMNSLNKAARQKMGEAYTRKTNGHYFFKSLHKPIDNSVWLDFNYSFYDNVYTLNHELFHVALESTSGYFQRTSEIQDLSFFRTPEADQKLTQKLREFIPFNEGRALEQQILLYHAVGDLTEQWGKVPRSAKAWHNHLFKNKYASRHLTKEDLTKPALKLNEFDESQRNSARAIAFQFEFAKILFGADSKDINISSQFFCNDQPDAWTFFAPAPITLYCEQAQHLFNLVSQGHNAWSLGLPIPAQIITLDGKPDNSCYLSTGHGGNDGGHGGNDGGHGGSDGGHGGNDGGHGGNDGGHGGNDGGHGGNDGGHGGNDGGHGNIDGGDL